MFWGEIIPPGKNLYGKANVDYDLPLSDKNPAKDKYYSNLQQRGIDYIDYRWIFSKTDVNHNQLYYKTDHRWKAYAAFIACQELVKHIENKYGEVMDYNKYYTDYSNYDTLVYYDAILGTYGKKTGYIYSGLDSLELIYPLNYQDSDYTWIYNENGDTFELSGNLLDTLMFNAVDVDEYFAGYDSCLDMYMDELHDKDTVINNNNPEGIKVAVLGDYYFSPMACFLAPMCSQMDIYDIRNNSMQSEFVELVKDGDYDYVILEMYPGSLKKGSFSFFWNWGELMKNVLEKIGIALGFIVIIGILIFAYIEVRKIDNGNGPVSVVFAKTNDDADCTLIFQNNTAVMIDTGEKEDSESVLKMLDDNGIKKLNYFLI